MSGSLGCEGHYIFCILESETLFVRRGGGGEGDRASPASCSRSQYHGSAHLSLSYL